MSDNSAVKRVLAVISPDTVSPGTRRNSPDTAAQPVRGSAKIDPERVNDSHQGLAPHERVSRAVSKRMLQAWEQDVRAEMVEENEGGPVKTTKADVLVAIRSAEARLMSPNRTQQRSVELSK